MSDKEKIDFTKTQNIRIQSSKQLSLDAKVTLHPSGVDISKYTRDIQISMHLEEALKAKVEYIAPEVDVIAEAKFYKYTPPETKEALDLILRYGGIDGSHHKTWVIDQVVRALTGDGYEEWVRNAKAGEDGPDTYSWDEGIAP